MKIKSMLMGAAATSAILGGMALQSSSAEAIDLKNGDTVQIIGNLRLSQTMGGLFDLNFDPPATQKVDGFSSSTPPFVDNDLVTISSLTGIALGSNFGAVKPFISGIDLTDGGIGTDTARFELTKGNLSKTSEASFLLTLGGDFFSTTNQKLGIGTFTTQLSTNSVLTPGGAAARVSFSSSLTVVPTPAAVLPALLGMGTAAFRKKKREGEDELALVGAEKA